MAIEMSRYMRMELLEPAEPPEEQATQVPAPQTPESSTPPAPPPPGNDPAARVRAFLERLVA